MCCSEPALCRPPGADYLDGHGRASRHHAILGWPRAWPAASWSVRLLALTQTSVAQVQLVSCSGVCKLWAIAADAAFTSFSSTSGRFDLNSAARWALFEGSSKVQRWIKGFRHLFVDLDQSLEQCPGLYTFIAERCSGMASVEVMLLGQVSCEAHCLSAVRASRSLRSGHFLDVLPLASLPLQLTSLTIALSVQSGLAVGLEAQMRHLRPLSCLSYVMLGLAQCQQVTLRASVLGGLRLPEAFEWMHLDCSLDTSSTLDLSWLAEARRFRFILSVQLQDLSLMARLAQNLPPVMQPQDTIQLRIGGSLSAAQQQMLSQLHCTVM